MRKLRNEELGRKSVEEFRREKKIPLVVVLDNIRSMNNIGSIFRTADAFLVEKLILCGITATPPHRDIHKTALGATDSVVWEYYEDIAAVIKLYRDVGYFVAAIEQAEESIMLQDFLPKPDQKLVIIFGHEIRGVQQKVVDLCDAAIEVPQFGTKHSLNISVCAGIVIWDLYKKLNRMH